MKKSKKYTIKKIETNQKQGYKVGGKKKIEGTFSTPAAYELDIANHEGSFDYELNNIRKQLEEISFMETVCKDDRINSPEAKSLYEILNLDSDYMAVYEEYLTIYDISFDNHMKNMYQSCEEYIDKLKNINKSYLKSLDIPEMIIGGDFEEYCNLNNQKRLDTFTYLPFIQSHYPKSDSYPLAVEAANALQHIQLAEIEIQENDAKAASRWLLMSFFDTAKIILAEGEHEYLLGERQKNSPFQPKDGSKSADNKKNTQHTKTTRIKAQEIAREYCSDLLSKKRKITFSSVYDHISFTLDEKYSLKVSSRSIENWQEIREIIEEYRKN